MSSAKSEKDMTLATYHHADLGDAPYIELSQLFSVLAKSSLINETLVEKVADHLYAVSQNRVIIFFIDTKKDTLTMKNFDYFACMGNVYNHGIGWDTASPSDTPGSSLRTSFKSTIIGTPQDYVYDFGRYSFDIVEGDNGKVYVPFQPIGSLLFSRTTYELVYNGLDFFSTMLISKELSSAYPGAYSSYYANIGQFLLEGNLYEATDTIGEETYRYAAKVDDGYNVFYFGADGSVEKYSSPNLTDKGTALPMAITFAYTDEKDGIYVNTATGSTFKIPKEKTYFNTKTRSASAAKHGLDVLRFQFENIYGLKKELYARYDVHSFDELLEKKGLRERLLSADSLDYDDAFSELLLGVIDDGHTKYINRSIYSGDPSDGTAALAQEKTGSRRGGLFEKKSEYTAKRTEVMRALDPAYEDEAKQLGLFMQDETAVLRFDSFVLSGGGISNFVGGRSPEYTDITEAMNKSVDEGFYLSFKELEKHSEIKNVVIDLTCNGGGMAILLPYLSACWSDDPTFRLYDNCLQVVKEFHYEVDFNRNGTFGDEGDTYKGKYEFFVLVSEFSFSCGNGLPTMAYSDGVTLIGAPHAGGGACPVATLCDGSGTVFNTSMPLQIVYKNEAGEYVNNDAGMPVSKQHQLPLDSWYDLEALNTFVKSI